MFLSLGSSVFGKLCCSFKTRFVRKYTMKVLNVAEKNDAAKNISSLLSKGNSSRREGFSVYNKIYEFNYNVFGQNCVMVMTSVSGHLLNYEFGSNYRSWSSCSPDTLFEAPVQKTCTADFNNIKRTLEREAKSCQKLIIWTDCDREGENIGFEIIDTCCNVNSRLDVYRAVFSEITGTSVKRAISNLVRPNKNISNAVDVRQELDLRIGAAFTRFQTLRLQKVFPVLADNLLSYGSCQFPTLGFVVERFLERERFIAEQFWRIRVVHKIKDLAVEFRWKRDRLFDEFICQSIFARCMEKPTATVETIIRKPKSKWRPTPLDTTEMEKIASRKLKINAKEALKIAEKLYTKGFISYPRTETNIFPDSINLSSLVEEQITDSRWGSFASTVLQEGPNPRQGKKSDQSHPPIHPIKYTDSLQGNDAKLYEFIVRHFLACVSKDAKGHETIVTIDINTEKFSASGLMILERNYLDVYPYENWNGKNIHTYTEGQTFEPTTLEITNGQTTAPNLLTEADLITLMEKHGIGTDATHAEHIETIKSRFYVGLEDNIHFVPSAIGMGLVEGYDTMGFAMSKPSLRAELEAGLKGICEGTKNPQIVLEEQIRKYRDLFKVAKEQVGKIDAAVGKYIQETAIQLSPEEYPARMQINPKLFPCWLCGMDIILKFNQEARKSYLSCSGFPNCKAAIWLPNKVTSVKASQETCGTCGTGVKKLDFKFSPGSMAPFFPNNYIGCIRGCDKDFIEMLGVRIPNAPDSRISTTQTSGIGSSLGSSSISSQQSGFERNSGPAESSSSSDRFNSGSSTNGLDRRNTNERGQKRPRGFPDGTLSGETQCYCMLPAKKLTVRRDGPNTGREFLVCSKETDDKCNFYVWIDEIADGIKCFCDLNAKKLTVKKPGPNQGKQFYSCPKAQNEGRCQFFIWEEERGDQSSGSGRNENNRASAVNNRNLRGRGRSQSSAGSRRCGQCGSTGHNRRNCSANQE